VDRLRNIFACTNWLDIAQDLVVNVGLGPRPAPRWPVAIEDEIVEEGPPVYARPPVYYRPYPYYGYPGYYRPWGFGWGWRGW
jgi:hypothetical protein